MEILVSDGYRSADMAAIPVRELAEHVLAAEDAPASCEVSVSFVDDAEMTELNGRFRGKEGPTDVLSFECDSLCDELSAAAPGEAPYELGDVIIAPDVAERQAAEYGQTLAQEIELFVVHGLLHLCGYDHMADDEAAIMEAREDALLRSWRERSAR